jgi:hypothetical protein
MINYNIWEKLLHSVFLGNKFIKKNSYEIEKLLFLEKVNKDIKFEKHVFISGLARSGTTALLNYLYNSSNFASLTYKDMPLIMMPNFFSKILKKKKIYSPTIQRMHNDGININLNSPESFDEVFFSTFNDNNQDEYLNFISLVLLRYKKLRYLSKNNNNYKRISTIKDIFPKSIHFITFRDPLQHALSLHTQHIEFLKIQKDNKFVKKYMNYLGHHEFGILHESWNIPIRYDDPLNINYWIEQWYLFYKNLLQSFSKDKKPYLFCYEKISKKNYLSKFMKIVEISSDTNSYLKFIKHDLHPAYDKDNLDKAMQVYFLLESLDIEN